MQLSNIKKLELEALAFALILHLLAILLYGVVAIQPKVINIEPSLIKINLAGLGSSVPALPTLVDDNATGVTPTLGKSDVASEKEVAAMPDPVKPVKAEKVIKSDIAESSTPQATEKDNTKYLELLQKTVQQNTNVPAEAAMNGISGKAILQLEFNRKGYVTNYTLKQSTGNKILDDAAMQIGVKLMTEPLPEVPADFYPEKKTLKFDFGIDYDSKNQ